jgi:hypothetical protein
VENPTAGDGGVVLGLVVVAGAVTLDVSVASREAARQRSPRPRRRPATPAIVTAIAAPSVGSPGSSGNSHNGGLFVPNAATARQRLRMVAVQCGDLLLGVVLWRWAVLALLLLCCL